MVTFVGQGSLGNDSLAQFSMWHNYLLQDYEGCYIDPDIKQYVYYDKNSKQVSGISQLRL